MRAREGEPLTVGRACPAGVPVVVAAPARSRRRPLVVLVHGLLDDPIRLTGWLVELAERGVVAVALRAAYGADEPGIRGRLCSDFLGALDEAVMETARRVAAAWPALEGLRGADPSQGALIGVSAGGFAAMRAALELEGARAVALVLSGPGWLAPPDLSEPGLQEELGLDLVPPRGSVAFLPERYPGLHAQPTLEAAQRLCGRAVLAVLGGRDRWMPPQPALRLIERLEALGGGGGERLQRIVYPALGHRLTLPMQRRVTSWVAWMLDRPPVKGTAHALRRGGSGLV